MVAANHLWEWTHKDVLCITLVMSITCAATFVTLLVIGPSRPDCVWMFILNWAAGVNAIVSGAAAITVSRAMWLGAERSVYVLTNK